MDQRSIMHYKHFLENIHRITLSDKAYDLEFLQHPLSTMSKFQLMYYNKTKEYYEMAIEDIYKAASNCSSAVIIKGYVEDSDLYSDYFRPYSDIDVLVSRSEIFSFVEKLADLGYSFADRKLTKEEVDLQLRIMQDQPHINRVFKKYGNITICSEIHVSLKGTWNQLAKYNNIDLTSIVMKDAEVIDSKFSRLSNVDRFVFGLEHFGKHLIEYFEYAWIRDLKFQIPFNFKSLFDSIALFYQYNLIDTNEIYERVEKLGFSHENRIANLFLRKIFEFDYLDDNKLMSCKNYEINDSERIAADYICNMDISALLNCNELIQGTKYIKYALSRSTCAIIEKGVANLVIDNNIDSITKRKYGSILKYPLLSKRKTHCSAEAKISIDESYLKIAMYIIDDCVKVFGDGQPNAWGESINIFIYNPRFIESHTFPVTGFFISPIYRGDSLTISASYNNDWFDKRGNITIDEKDIPHKVALTDSGYMIEVHIGWELLGINPSALDYLGADFVINDVDSNDPVIDTVMSWSNPTLRAHNPARYGIIKFKNL